MRRQPTGRHAAHVSASLPQMMPLMECRQRRRRWVVKLPSATQEEICDDNDEEVRLLRARVSSAAPSPAQAPLQPHPSPI